MSFIVKNIDVVNVPINDLGITIDAGQEYDLTQESPNDIAFSTDLPNAISGGQLIILDPLDGTTQLSISESLDVISLHNDPHYRIRGGLLSHLDDVLLGSPIGNNYKLAYNEAGGYWHPVVSTATPPSGSEYSVQLNWGPIGAYRGTTSIDVQSNTFPSITEGTQIWSASLDIQNGDSSLRISTNVTFAASNRSMEFVLVAFRGTDPIGAAVNTTAKRGKGHILSFEIYDQPGVTGNVTYSVRVGKNGGGGAWYVNALPHYTNPLGGILENNAYTLEEIGVVS